MGTKERLGKKVTFRGIWDILKKSFSGFSDDKVTKMSGALAYYTVFSMAPLLLVIISLTGIFLGQEAVEGKVYGTLSGFMGPDTARQLQTMIENASLSGKGTIAVIIGVITLAIGATTVFAEIQDSINTIWGLKAKPKMGLWKLIQTRFLSFSVIISLGFILLVSLAITTVIDSLFNNLMARFPDVTVIVFYVVNQIFTLGVITLIFAVVFKVLPDAHIRWKDVLIGSVVTAILFMLGKFAISFYISKTNVGSTYGAAGSLVIVLLWAYFSSIILYFGAELTKAYAVKYGEEIRPSYYAVTTDTVEIEKGKQSIQDKETSKEKREKKS